jgi:hydroxymethylpyrimidine/phosphomethylpyrimidine kinase
MTLDAKPLLFSGFSYVLIKGGHLPGSDDVVDVLYDGNGDI